MSEKRYAFIKDDIPELAPKIMVAITEIRTGTSADLVDFRVCDDEADVAAYLDLSLGAGHSICWRRSVQ